MNFLRSRFFIFSFALTAVIATSCKSKKAVVKPAAPVSTPPPPPPAPKPAPAPAPAPEPAPAPAPPDYNFKNIQFEFNSGILKTDAYPILDKAAAEIKKDQSVKFLVGGHSSAEGTEQHNQALSVERANAVKTYLVNSGVNGDNLVIKGYGETKPISNNTDEAGRALNRRVEIKKQ
ncbi:OmpA family protein [Mucilaginibacter pallidiroseus]|uniref:OmpA family protein n=1 Tax=Mucilaginibacter pallidiroseus TaxID=2599295 RepID=A0A563U8K1_9SPHI|nr:OmpA family protein [Mucilaginibacter pallidiroseus]TWR27609.1 OmpA family protein [Mucilaginibacter pallidiroseus]